MKYIKNQTFSNKGKMIENAQNRVRKVVRKSNFCIEIFAETTKYFLSKTGIHGCQYLVDENNANRKFSSSRYLFDI